MRHIIDIVDFTRAELDSLLSLGLDIAASPLDYADSRRGSILASLFFEPSTRTRLSFESAMLSLGGQTLGFSEPASTSASKGESIADTVRMAASYSDIICMRHPLEGATMVGARYSPVPLINAGDGGHCHPTQTLTDLLTLLREMGTIDNLKIGICGDLKYGRTVHSLINALSFFTGVELVLISPIELDIPKYMKKGALSTLKYSETDSLDSALPTLDVLYMTRIQRERFEDENEYERLKGSYILTADKARRMKSRSAILHPLPRVDEITTDVDFDPRAAYFRQARNGRYVRMALLHTLLARDLKPKEIVPANARYDFSCKNPRCAAFGTPDVKQIFVPENDGYKCLYCEKSFIKA